MDIEIRKEIIVIQQENVPILIVPEEHPVTIEIGQWAGGGGGGGSAVWGSIGGNIANQTDLMNLLDDKPDIEDLGDLAAVNDAPYDGKLYGRKNNQWQEVTGGGGGSAEWGSIGGDIADQTDLQDALDEKADADDLGDMAAVNDAPTDGKLYGRRNNQWQEVTGGGGSGQWGSITGTLSDQTDLQDALDGKAPADTIAEEFSSSTYYPHQVNYAYHNGILYKFAGPYQGPFEDIPLIFPVMVTDDVRYLLMFKLDDAPTDGKTYGRKNGAWSETIDGTDWGDIGGTLSDQTDLQNALDGKAASNHNHDTRYAAINHDHDASYSAINHNHDGVYSPVGHNHDLDYADINHNHDTDYADINHNHDTDYAALNHNHDLDYADISHNHDTDYSAINHNHDTDYAAINHNHDADYAAINHNHDADYAPKASLMMGVYLNNSPLTTKTIYELYQDARGDYGKGSWMYTLMVGQVGSTTTLAQSLPVTPCVVTITQFNNSTQERAVLTCQGVSQAVIKHCHIWQGTISSWY